MRPVRTRGGCGAAVDVEVLEDLLEVVLHREEAAAEDEADLVIGFSFGNPMQDLCLALSQTQTLP
ncbi:MAG: hypothetical protein HS117_05110 [Verrucomicrobiaceae bacterium]|jgi:hypothetical protein|nr:hypothetical protein [Verrucomicrobiaceae bacterium]